MPYVVPEFKVPSAIGYPPPGGALGILPKRADVPRIVWAMWEAWADGRTFPSPQGAEKALRAARATLCAGGLLRRLNSGAVEAQDNPVYRIIGRLAIEWNYLLMYTLDGYHGAPQPALSAGQETTMPPPPPLTVVRRVGDYTVTLREGLHVEAAARGTGPPLKFHVRLDGTVEAAEKSEGSAAERAAAMAEIITEFLLASPAP